MGFKSIRSLVKRKTKKVVDIVKPKVELYTDLDFMPIGNFDRVLGGDFAFMKVGHRRGTIEVLDSFFVAWDILYNKFCELTENNDALLMYVLEGEINYLEDKLTYVPIMLEQLCKSKPKEIRKEYIKELSAWNFTLNQRKPFDQEIKRFNKQIRATETRLKIKREELKDLQKSSGSSLTLSQQKAKLHKILKINIDVWTCPVTEWLAYWDEVQNEAALNKKRHVESD